MARLSKRISVDRSGIDVTDASEMKRWMKALGISEDDLLRAIAKVGNAAAAVRKELRTTAEPGPLKPDFPFNAQGTDIVTQGGHSIAKTPDPAIAEEVADRLNINEMRREGQWSA